MPTYKFEEHSIEMVNPSVERGAYIKHSNGTYDINVKLSLGSPQANAATYVTVFRGFIPSGDVKISTMESQMITWIQSELVKREV